MEVTDFKNVQLSNISFKNPEKFKGSYICYAKYDNDQTLNIQTPRMKNLDGVHKTETRAHLDLYFQKEHIEFYNFLGDFDDTMLATIQKNGEEWFNKQIPSDVLEDLYSTPLKHKNPPKFKLKVPLSRGKIELQIIDIDNNSVDADNIPDNCELVVLMKFLGLKFLKEQVLSEWVPIQIKICEKVESKKESLINDSLIKTDKELNIEIDEFPDDLDNMDELTIDDEEEEEEEESDDDEEEETEKEENRNVDEDLNENWKKKYEEKEVELNLLKNQLKNFIN